MKVIVLAIFAFVSFLSALGKTSDGRFSSLTEAQSVFKTNISISVKTEAFEYARKKLYENKHSQMSGLSILPVVCQMADGLGRTEVANVACRDLLASSNDAVRVAAAITLCERIKRLEFPQSDRELRELAAEFSEESKLRSIALSRVIEVNVAAHRFDDARASADEIFMIGTNAHPSAYVSACYFKIDDAASKDNFSEVEKTTLAMLSVCNSIPDGMLSRLSKTKLPPENTMPIVDAIRSLIADAAISGKQNFSLVAETYGIGVVTLLRSGGYTKEALSECRVLTTLASSMGYRNCVLLAAETLKVLDGNLRRVREYITFHKKDIVPTSKNIILSFPRLRDSARQKLIKELDSRRGESFKELIDKSRFYLWADEPRKALEAAILAFSIAPLNQSDLQTCANAAMRPIVAFSRDPKRGEIVASYLLYGSAGPDGSIGTADDIVSPVSDLIQYMKSCGYALEGDE